MVLLRFYKNQNYIGVREYPTKEKAEKVGQDWLLKANALFPQHINRYGPAGASRQKVTVWMKNRPIRGPATIGAIFAVAIFDANKSEFFNILRQFQG